MQGRRFCVHIGLSIATILGLQDPALAGLSGTVLHFDGTTVAGAKVRAVSQAEGVDARTESTADGVYEFADLPTGTYVVSVNMPCCLFFPYVNDSVVVDDDETTELDIQLAAFNVDVEGDDPGTINQELERQQVIPDLPVPRMSDGKPDLTGTWLVYRDAYPNPPPALEWAQAVFERSAAANFIDSPSAHCLPGSLPAPGGGSFIAGFVQRPELLVILLEEVGGFRQVFLDGREHPEKPNPTWFGHSIGRWEGDTLVVDTVGFNDRGTAGDYPRTTALRVEERYTRTSYGELEVTVTFEDPGVFSAPWSEHLVWQLAPQVDIMEYVCENNIWQGTTAQDVGLSPQ